MFRPCKPACESLPLCLCCVVRDCTAGIVSRQSLQSVLGHQWLRIRMQVKCQELLHRALRHARRKRIQFARSIAANKMADQQAACASLIEDSNESQKEKQLLRLSESSPKLGNVGTINLCACCKTLGGGQGSQDVQLWRVLTHCLSRALPNLRG